MSLKNRLQRLRGSEGNRRGGLRDPRSAGLSERGAIERPGGPRKEASVGPPGAPGLGAASLTGAARMLDAALGRRPGAPSSPGIPPTLAERSVPVTPLSGGVPPAAPTSERRDAFERDETPAGTILRRALRVPLVESRSGPLHLLARAEPSVLALLALDPSLSGVAPQGALFFDTETTGLGGAGALAFLVGLGFMEGGQFVLEQFLLQSPSQEPALLFRLRERFARAAMLVSFNGKSFDLPLLSTRCTMNRESFLPGRPHLDLLHVARRIHKRRLGAFRLSVLEREVLGIERPEDDIDGAEIPPRFGHFLRTGEYAAVAPVVLHNEWDVLSMAALVGVYGSPSTSLGVADLLGVAETYRRAGELGGALELVASVMEHSPSAEALHLRARLQKAQGERARALLDFERLHEQHRAPEITLELVKLYEHHRRDFERALALLEGGTGESEEALQRRRARLEKKVARRRERGS